MAEPSKRRGIAVRVRRHDEDLDCDVSKVVGYRTACRCGWRSPIESSPRRAKEWLAQHRRELHRQTPGG